jgi:hypothetical protein
VTSRALKLWIGIAVSFARLRVDFLEKEIPEARSHIVNCSLRCCDMSGFGSFSTFRGDHRRVRFAPADSTDQRNTF